MTTALDVGAIPSWLVDVDRVLRDASRRTTPISSATPRNLRSEHTRVVEAWERGREATPVFDYAGLPDLTNVTRALDAISEALVREGPLGACYAERAEELVLESRIIGAVGTQHLAAASLARFGYRDGFSDEADEIARAWAETPHEAADAPELLSDDPGDARSLLSRVRAGVGARRLSVRVVVSRNLSPLAAVGENVIQIAEGRRISARDAERTALHEIEGHLVPQSRAALETLGLFAVGTKRGSDDQEGRALCLERRAGFLVGARRAELGRRHLAARAVHRGSELVETVRLLRDLGATVADAVRLAFRAHRGSERGVGGLAREIVYLPAMLRVEARVASDATADDILARGRVAAASVETLRPFVATE